MKKLPLLGLAALLAAPASATQWDPLGAQSFAMGGAGVAYVTGPLASYWNPGAYARGGMSSSGFALPIGVEAHIDGPVLQGASDLSNALNNGVPGNVVGALNELNHPGEGVRGNAMAGGDLKIGPIDVFVNSFLNFSAQPNADVVNVQTGGGSCPGGFGVAPCFFKTNPALPNPTSNNTSSLVVKGASITEFGGGYGHELPILPGLYVGGNVKLIRADVGYVNYAFLQSQNGVSISDIEKQFTNTTKTSANIGFDAGALWDLDRTWDILPWSPRLGLVGRNINNPKFSDPSGTLFALNPQYRAGLSFSPFNWWHFALDQSLSRDLTTLSGLADQELAVGTEIDVFNRPWINIPLRAGMRKNWAMADSPETFTAGFGFNLLHFNIDFAGEAADKHLTVPGGGSGGGNSNSLSSIPRELGAMVQISFLFGSDDSSHSTHVSAPAATPAASSTLSPSDAAKVRANADKAQQQLNQQTVH